MNKILRPVTKKTFSSEYMGGGTKKKVLYLILKIQRGTVHCI